LPTISYIKVEGLYIGGYTFRSHFLEIYKTYSQFPPLALQCGASGLLLEIIRQFGKSTLYKDDGRPTFSSLFITIFCIIRVARAQTKGEPSGGGQQYPTGA